jgi:hypothetical protein
VQHKSRFVRNAFGGHGLGLVRGQISVTAQWFDVD